MATIADVYRALNAMVEEGIAKRYAVCGGTGALFYTQTLRTYDIDVFVETEQKGLIINVSAVYNWGRARGYEVRDIYLIVHNVPIQVLDASAGIEQEATKSANLLDYDGVSVPVVRPEYLILFYAKAGGRDRITRALDLLERAPIDHDLVSDVAARYNLEEAWAKLQEEKKRQ